MTEIVVKNQEWLTAELVESVYKEYIAERPSFLGLVDLRIEEVVDMAIGSLKTILPYYTPNTIGVIPEISPYQAQPITVTWNNKSFLNNARSLSQVEESLYLTKTLYKNNFVKTLLKSILYGFESRFSVKLNAESWPSISLNFPLNSDSNANFGWNDLLERYHKWVIFQGKESREHRIPLMFIPTLSSVNYTLIGVVEQYMKNLGSIESCMVTSPQVLASMALGYNAGGGDTFKGLKYKNGYLDTGALKITSLPSLRPIREGLGRAMPQGLCWNLISINDSNDDVYMLKVGSMVMTSQIQTNTYLAKGTPLVFNIPRYSPISSSLSNISNTHGQNFNLVAYVSERTDFVPTGIMNIPISKKDLVFIGEKGIVTVDSYIKNLADFITNSQRDEVFVATPWIIDDFLQIFTKSDYASQKIPILQEHNLYNSYVYPKEAIQAFALKPKKRDYGIEENIITTENIPLLLRRQGMVLTGSNMIIAEGAMSFGIASNLGGKLMAVGRHHTKYA